MLRSLRRWPVLLLTGVCLLLAAGCTLAGVWQVHRFDWKRHDNAGLRANDAAAPVPVGDLLAVGRPLDEGRKLRKVTAAGVWDPAGQLLVRQRTVGAHTGFLVLTPLRTDGGTLWTVRGFVRATAGATVSPAVPAPAQGRVEVTARVYPDEPPQPTTGLPPGQIERIDTATLGAGSYRGYAELVDTDPGLTALDPPDLSNPAGGALVGQHLAYVVQWFFFALLALAAPVLLPALDRRAEAAARLRQPAEPKVPTG